ncbi:MAG: serine hydrolase domain-containing protein [Burkholderiaceae bacterium]
MKAALRVGSATLAFVVLWAVVLFAGTSSGWWKQALAPRGDTAGFMGAAARLVDSGNKGNAVFAVIEGGSVHRVHAVSVGDAVDVDTVFQVASLSKWVTAWGVMALVQEGKIDLEAPVGTYLTRWALPDSKFDHSKVTVRRLLSHTAGLSDGLGYAGFAPGAVVPSLEDSLRRPDADPGIGGVIEVGHEPGSEWKYSGGGYAILQLLIEEVSGEPFAAFMQRVVFRPLGMVRSSYTWTPATGSTLAKFYGVDSRPTPHYRFSAVAAVSLYTSVSDLTRFVQAHLPGKGGEPIGRGVLSPATIEEMRRPHASKFGEDIWGLGTMLYASNNKAGFIVGHDGNRREPPINTAVRFNPANGNGIVILETGTPRLATRLAGEWVFWETGNVDFISFAMAVSGVIRLIGIGSVVIVLAVPTVAWSLRRKRKRRALEAGSA